MVLMSTPPTSSCPPSFIPSAALDSKMAPAHVPHTGLCLANTRRGSVRPAKRARRAMVVDSARISSVTTLCLCALESQLTSTRDNQCMTLHQFMRFSYKKNSDGIFNPDLLEHDLMLGERPLQGFFPSARTYDTHCQVTSSPKIPITISLSLMTDA